jgi:hypothetical protein
MAINSTYYINAANLATATAVYLDSALSLIAPDGFYSDGVISREQSLGILLTANACPECGTPCGESIGGSGGQGLYLVNLNAGTDVGAILIRFDPDNVPDGIKAVYDGNTYNKLSSPQYGVLESTNPLGFTVFGSVGSDCGLSGNITNIPNATEYLYSGGSFVPTGNTQSITINPGDVVLKPSAPGSSVMVIPKVNPSPNIVNISIIGPCTGTAWNLLVSCPAFLPSFTSSVKYNTASIPCGAPLTQTFYFAEASNFLSTVVQIDDLVFEDAYGATPLANGFYLTSTVANPNKVIQVQNGAIIGITNCI